MIPGEQREAVRARLAALEIAGGGRLTPDAVVEDARDPQSPLHDLFEWDDAKAAYQHRLDQARAIITSVRVVQKVDSTIVRAHYYVRDPSAGTGQQGYVSTERLRTDAELSREAIVGEFERVAHMLRRAREIAKALGAEEDVEALLRGVVDLRTRFEQPSTPAQQ